MKILSKSNNLAILSIFIIGLSLIQATNAKKSQAVKAQDFTPGRIIDDEIFYNKDTMSVQQIQNFLDSQNPNCDLWGESPARDWGRPDISRREFAKQKWNIEPPFVCLNKYYENPETKETSFEKGGGKFEGGISAAQIIHDSAQKYGINPQVLIVLLKKESAGPLTNDAWPLKNQYTYAMGYGCPDSGPGFSPNCNDQKSGFYKQMSLAAWQLKYYKDHPNDYSLKLGWNNIQYSPNPACGTKKVNIENIATLSLYIYTPYTPNDASLENYPRTAPCGAYGNRNFFMFFNELFGSTLRQEDNSEKTPEDNSENINIQPDKTQPEDKKEIAEFSKNSIYNIGFNNHTKALSLEYISAENGTEIIAWDVVKNRDTQKFIFEKTPDNNYIIRLAKNKNRVLDLPNSNTSNKTPLILWDYNGGCNQKWKISKNRDNTFEIASSCNKNKFFTFEDKKGSNITISDKNSSPNQKWNISELKTKEHSSKEDIENGKIYTFESKNNKVMDIEWASSKNGSKIILWSKNGGKNQKFKAEKTPDGSYIFRSQLDNNKVIDLSWANIKNGSPLIIWNYNGGCNQKWKISKKQNGKFNIRSSCKDSQVVDVFNREFKDRSPVIIWGNNNQDNQEWSITEVK